MEETTRCHIITTDGYMAEFSPRFNLESQIYLFIHIHASHAFFASIDPARKRTDSTPVIWTEKSPSIEPISAPKGFPGGNSARNLPKDARSICKEGLAGYDRIKIHRRVIADG